MKKKLAIYALLLLLFVPAFASDNIYWVQESWLSSYERADTSSPVIAHWVVNSEVSLLESAQEWCHVKVKTGQEGFVKCSAIAKDKILTAKDPMMSFWMEPSLANWEAAGKYLEKNLSENDRNEEYDTGKSKRFPIPEFEAMKERMKIGSIQVGKFSELKDPNDAGFNSKRNTCVDADVNDLLKGVQRKIDIKPSFFKSTDDVIFLTDDLISEVARKINFSGGNSKLIKVNPVEVYGDNNTREMGGFWDVGVLDIEFNSPIYFHKLGANGLVEVSRESRAQTTFPRITCGGDPLYEAKFSTKLKDYPSVENSLANFYLRSPLPLKFINVKSTLKKQQIAYSISEPSINNKQVEETNFLLYEMDLDKDGVVDVLVENFYTKGGMGGLNSNWKRYINVQGHWFFVNGSYEEDCT